MDDLNMYWEETLSLIKKEISNVSYDTWIKTLKPIKLSDTKFIAETIEIFHKKTIEQRYTRLIQNALKEIIGKDLKLEICLPNTIPDENNKKVNSSITIDPLDVQSNLIPRYVFESFVVGNSNRMAHAAAVAVAESPGEAYNPLFLYGGVGLGKTHLMHSIAHHILKQNPNTKVLYASCEKFTNELINSIREKKNQEFRNKYRNIDVLLIDDIQFISDKESTQEEFFHTFNTLWEASKQIIISSDRPPKEIQTLEDRLRSRFEWGLIADIKLPDFETRTAILEKKAEIDGISLPKEVFQFIAKSIISNIRELEGALTRVIAYAKLANNDVTVELAEEALKELVNSSEKQEITVEYIQNIVSDYYEIKLDDLISKRRSHNIAYPRQVAMYLCRKLLDDSLVKIGEKFGGRDHSTVIHGCDKISDDIENNPEIRRTVFDIEKKILHQ